MILADAREMLDGALDQYLEAVRDHTAYERAITANEYEDMLDQFVRVLRAASDEDYQVYLSEHPR